MSKKSDARTALIAEKIVREQAWVYEQRIVRGLSWHAIRGLALRPEEAGGIGRNFAIGTLKDMVAAHRVAQGDVIGTADERRERRQLELDEMALLARASIAKAAELETLDIHAMKVLLDVRAAEAKMHGDDKPVEIKADIVHHDAIIDELNAELIALGEATVEA